MTAIISDTILKQIADRAPQLDADNQFCAADIELLKEAGYLSAFTPTQLGGAGLAATEVSRLQRRLAQAAPATALAVNMHQVWVGVARSLFEQGDKSLEWVLKEAAAGEIFAFGISEPGNDVVLLDAKTTADKNADGYLISGTKVFTTLSPAWTRLGLHARCGDRLIFGFVERDAAGKISNPGEWNPVGMRATHSYTTVLEDVQMRNSRVVRDIAPYEASDLLVGAIFANFSLLTASVYQGLAERAIELATTALQRAVTLMDGTETTAGANERRGADFAAAVLGQRAALNSLELLCAQLDSGELFNRPDAFLALAAAKNQICDAAANTVEMACAVSGTSAFQADSELARLRRDVAAAQYHPTSAAGLLGTVRRFYGV
ncbi:acyl-CoA dehydrogenase family protein [Canibacter zhoujuaniae]|uniref:acyl-CoA dehydrogenase family protein n=1 Tax=Canibacter zhoujuaniae TaxID=2708343 RepID=UPI00141F6087|nr:acyl-CoA dehydrogenase family protein [Canibacter zhoujuaniae]